MTKTVFMGDGNWGLFFLKYLLKKQPCAGIVVSSYIFDFIQSKKVDNALVFRFKDKNYQGWKEFVRDTTPDLIIAAGFPFILKEQFLKIAPRGILNIHPSFLPYYRGPRPLEWQIINGESQAGVTIHFMDEGIDSGEIVAQDRVRIVATDNLKTVQWKVMRKGARLLDEVLQRIEVGKLEGFAQDESLATYWGPISEDDARINWCRTSREIFNLVRGLQPGFPAFSEVNGYRCSFYHVTENIESLKVEPGRIISGDPLVVGTSDGSLTVHKYHIQNYMAGAQPLIGREVFTKGDRFS